MGSKSSKQTPDEVPAAESPEEISRRMDEHRRVVNLKTPESWYTTGAEGGCTIDGVQYSPAECYSMSLELEPTQTNAWCELGIAGGGTVSSIQYSPAECYLKALELDVEKSFAWGELGVNGGGTVNNVAYGQADCFVRALELDSENSGSTWGNLGVSGGGVVNGVEYSQAECFLKNLELDPTDARSWEAMAGGGGCTVSGVDYSATDCWVRVVELAPDDKKVMAAAWHQLHESACEDMKLVFKVNGKDYDTRACGGEMMKYIEIAPDDPLDSRSVHYKSKSYKSSALMTGGGMRKYGR